MYDYFISLFIQNILLVCDFTFIGYVLLTMSNHSPTYKDVATGKQMTLIMFVKSKAVK